jgi:hypothetical protein
MAPLRASRAAFAPYLGNIQDRYAGAQKFARAKAQDIVRHPPKAARLLTNRYVLISLAAGACVFVVRRLQRWRRLHQRTAPRARQQRVRSAPARKTNRAPVRGARVH